MNAINTDLAIDEIRKELCYEITSAELEIAKRHLFGSLAGDITTVFNAMEKLKSAALAHLRPDYYRDLVHAISSIDAIPNEILSKYFDPAKFSTVVVK